MKRVWRRPARAAVRARVDDHHRPQRCLAPPGSLPKNLRDPATAAPLPQGQSTLRAHVDKLLQFPKARLAGELRDNLFRRQKVGDLHPVYVIENCVAKPQTEICDDKLEFGQDGSALAL